MSREKNNVTETVGMELPLHLQNMLWYLLECKVECPKQVHYFDLEVTVGEDGQLMQKIVHRVPAYQKEHRHLAEVPVRLNVMIKIDGAGNQFMMISDK